MGLATLVTSLSDDLAHEGTGDIINSGWEVAAIHTQGCLKGRLSSSRYFLFLSPARKEHTVGLRIAGSEGHQSDRLQAVEFLLGQFEISLEGLSETVASGEVEAHRQRRKLADSVADALQDPSLSDASRSVFSHAYSLLAN